jgi:hypothetical protein
MAAAPAAPTTGRMRKRPQRVAIDRCPILSDAAPPICPISAARRISERAGIDDLPRDQSAADLIEMSDEIV